MGSSAAKGRSLSSFVLASMLSEIFSFAAGAVVGSEISSLTAASDFSSMICGSLTVTVGRWPLPSHAALPNNIPRLFVAGITFSAKSFASMPFGNCTRKHSMPIAMQFFGQLLRRSLAGVVAVVSDINSLCAVLLERSPVIVGETVDAVARRYVAIARAPERQRVDQRFTQDDFLRGDECLFVPHPAHRSRQVRVQRRVFAQRSA